MLKNFSILLLLAIIIALPFALRRRAPASQYAPGDPVLVIVTPHNEAIRYEFGRAFSQWHRAKYGTGVKIEWRAVGGTTEIMRYLASEYASAARAWWTGPMKRIWPAGAGDALTAAAPPKDPSQLELYNAFRVTDDPEAFSARIDLFFGGGEFDHSTAFRQGLTVAPWPQGQEPAGLFTDSTTGISLIPQQIGGETWRTPTVQGNVVSAFGICYNVDRLRELNIPVPASWDDLASPRFFKQVSAADPTKSGSVAKSFEMMIHQKISQAVAAAGFSGDQVEKFEREIAAYRKQKGADYKAGDLPDSVPPPYQQAIERGWRDGLALVQLIGANARYFTDSSSRVAIDVGAGDAAAGMVIDFYGRYQAQTCVGPGGRRYMKYLTPVGGSSVACDPIGLLRGAGGGADTPAARRLRRRVAVRFIEFTLSEEGQKLWTYRAGEPGGPEKFTLRRLPIRRDFYPSTNPVFQARHQEHLKHAADDLAAADIDPYRLAQQFTYHPRWTASHFGVHRDLIRAMCMDASDELRQAWRAVIEHGGPASNPVAMAALRALPTVTLHPRGGVQAEPHPVRLSWRTAPDIPKKYDRMEYLKQWTLFYSAQYREVMRMLK